MTNKNDSFFDDLCQEYYKKIYKYLYFNLKDESIVMDTVQDVFLTVYEKIDIVKKHPNPGGFLFQTAKNLMKKRRREIYNKFAREISNDENMIEEIKDNSSDIFYIMDSRINEENFLTDVFSRLSNDKKELYSLYYLQNNSMENISKKLGIEYSALRMRYVRLRREIKEIVNKISEENFNF